jgi:hypothetical protein
MPLTAACPNCLTAKTNYEEYYCPDCQKVVDDVEAKADNDKLSMFEYRSLKEQALAGRRMQGNMARKTAPNQMFKRIDDTAFRARMGLDK